MNLQTRKHLLETVCYGGKEDYLRNRLNIEFLTSSLSEHQTNRIENSLSLKSSIIPVSDTIYTIKSHKDDKVDEYTINLNVPSCTCSDFLYRCDYTDGEKCKHIWRIIFLTKLNALPSKQEDPKPWLFYELERDRMLLESKGLREYSEDIQETQDYVRTTALPEISFERIFFRWLTLIDDALAENNNI